MRALVIVLAALFLAGTANAAPAKKPTAQQQKMGACATETPGKKGDEYKQAMSACLSK